MYCKFVLTSLSTGILLASNAFVYAAHPVDLQKTSFSTVNKGFAIQWPGAAHRASSTASASQLNQLSFVKKRTDKNKITHTRLQQTYAGFPVVGGYAILHGRNAKPSLQGDHQAVQMDGVLFEDLQKELGEPLAYFAQHAQSALNAFVKPYAGIKTSDAVVAPVVYMDEANKAHWAYKLSVTVHHRDKIPARPSAIIDATTQKPFVEWNDIKSIHDAVKGKGFGGNSKVGEYQFGEGDYPYLEMTRDADTETCFMENDSVRVVDMEHRYRSKKRAMSFACPAQSMNPADLSYWTGYEADGYDRGNGAFSPSNDAMYAGFVIKHMYFDWYGIEPLVRNDGSPMQMIMRVHYGDEYGNAYWDGKQMTFGDGDYMMYPLVSLGVGAHEISHGFTEQHADLAYYGQSGGMNEAFSDMAAQAAEYFSVGKNSWQIGPEIMKEDSGYDALRYMDTPSKDGQSIDTAEDYYGGLDVHYSSGVYNRLFYLMAQQSGWDVRKAFDVMVKANMDYWTPYSNFKNGGCGVLKATRDLGYSLDDVQQALDGVLIDYSACEIG